MSKRKQKTAVVQQLTDALINIEGVALCLNGLTEYLTPGDSDAPFRYLGKQLKEHFLTAFAALEEIEKETGGAP
jgi:hypothetical protein